jgi:glycerophosphoryl diester phosphodiesterase
MEWRLKMKKVLKVILFIPILLLLLVVVVSLVMSPPWAGKSLAAKAGIPYRAIIAHRGVSGLVPEATAPAFLLAREIKADYLEADMQRTKDGVIVAFHDDTLERTTDVAREFPGRESDFIETFTYGELMQLDAGSWFNAEYPDKARDSFVGLRILTLNELIDIAEGSSHKPGLYLETKSAPRHAGIEQEIVDILAGRGWLDPQKPGRVIFQSFYPDSIIKLKELTPHTLRVLLISAEIEAERGFDNLIAEASAIADGIGPVGYLGWPWLTGKAHRADLIVHPYVINATWQMRLLTFFGADGIFTDYAPDALKTIRGTDVGNIDTLLSNIGY